MPILSMLKPYTKYITIAIIGVTLVATLYFGWGSIKQSYVDEGYRLAKTEYQELLIKEINKNTQEYESKLISLRQKLKEQSKLSELRLQENNDIDKEVVKVTEYIEREVYVESQCNNVDPNLIRMFNQSIGRANTSREDKP